MDNKIINNLLQRIAELEYQVAILKANMEEKKNED